MTITVITTGVQTVTATGAVTGSLDTSVLVGEYTVKLRVDGLPAGETAVIALEDTANASAFSDKVQIAVVHVVGKVNAESPAVFSKRSRYEIPGTRFGLANSKLRFNVLSKTGSGNLLVYGWLEQ